MSQAGDLTEVAPKHKREIEEKQIETLIFVKIFKLFKSFTVRCDSI